MQRVRTTLTAFQHSITPTQVVHETRARLEKLAELMGEEEEEAAHGGAGAEPADPP